MVDESEGAKRVLEYVARLASGRSPLRIVLAHIAPGLPPELLETGGAEQPDREVRIEAELRTEQRQAIDRVHRSAARGLNAARAALLRAGVAARRIETRQSSPLAAGSAVDALLTLAEEAKCGTMVVSHRAHGWLRGVGGGHLAEHLVRKAAGRAVWVVD
jgi:nucleotide-binding universal stress UspA family protein